MANPATSNSGNKAKHSAAATTNPSATIQTTGTCMPFIDMMAVLGPKTARGIMAAVMTNRMV